MEEPARTKLLLKQEMKALILQGFFLSMPFGSPVPHIAASLCMTKNRLHFVNMPVFL